MITFVAPIRLHSELNARGHWSKRASRFARQRNEVWMICRGSRAIAAQLEQLREHLRNGGRVEVLITKLGPVAWDDDNIRGGAKAVRDELAALLQVDDGDGRIKFDYHQETTKKHGIRVRVEAV